MGRFLVEAKIHAARTIGYHRMRPDTTLSMAAARRLYESLGLLDIQPYCFNPVEGATSRELTL